MRAVDIIRAKRDGEALSRAAIDAFVHGVGDGSWADYQTSALLMAIVLKGMNPEETAWLTDAMVRSGDRVRLDDIPGIKVGKHSTGGVGDKVSIVLAPVAAACGVVVPKMSGRGLGHTGGTLDKCDAIPGYITQPDIETLRRVVRAVGCAIIGQTGDIAPADRRLYAIRDVTATVESIPLITASILSKKLAAGLDALVMDIKVGSGAFAPSLETARALGESLLVVADDAGLRAGTSYMDPGGGLTITVNSIDNTSANVTITTNGTGALTCGDNTAFTAPGLDATSCGPLFGGGTSTGVGGSTGAGGRGGTTGTAGRVSGSRSSAFWTSTGTPASREAPSSSSARTASRWATLSCSPSRWPASTASPIA